MNKEETTTIEAIVCPECFHDMPHSKVLPPQTNRYNTELRTYLGFCLKCQSGWEVVQFKRETRWVINKYQKYPLKQIGSDMNSLVSPAGIEPVKFIQPGSKWTTLNELPGPAPVVTGPGKEYDQEFTPETSELFENFKKALDALSVAVECLLRHFQK